MSAGSAVWWILAVVIVDGLAALVGGLVPERLLRRARPFMFALATVMLVVSGGELIVEGFERSGPLALVWALAAFVGVGLLELATSRRRAHRATPVNAPALLVSDGLHNFADGVAIAASFLVSLPVGLSTSLGVIVHELPEELADYALLRAGGMRRRRALVSLALVQLTAGLGALSTLFVSAWITAIVPVVVSIAGGMFLYIAIVNLLPEVIAELRGARSQLPHRS